MSLVTVIIIAVSLSMDAFSLSLAYGTLSITKDKIKKLSIIVGCFHFFMPLLGMIIGNKMIDIFELNTNIVIFIVLFYIGINMFITTKEEVNNPKLTSNMDLILFGLAVSLDSFSVGIGIEKIYSSPIICSIVFALCSLVFTYLGLILGTKINKKIGKISTKIGGIMLIIIGVLYIL